MSEDFEKLKKFGAQKIHDDTHISVVHAQAILHESFADMNSVQLFGFISILEREYALDLSELREKAKEHFKNNTPTTDNKILSNSLIKKKRKFKPIYIIFGVITAALSAYFIIEPSKDISYKIDNSTIESAKSNILEIQNDKNSSMTDENSTLNAEKTEELPKSVETVETEAVEIKDAGAEAQIFSFKIIPNNKVWLGYIDLKDYKRYQQVLSDELILDPAKEWLLLFGHGYVSIEIDGEIKKFTNPKNIIFSYINSELKEIDMEEFKRLNKGRGW